MNEYPPEREDQQPQISEHQPSQPRPRRQPPPRRSWTDRLPLIFSAAAMVLAGAALFFVLRGDKPPEEPPPPEEPVTFQYRDQTMTPLEGMPTNSYDRSAFVKDEKGRLVYEKDGKRAKTGIDVSVYQGEIDWPAVAADGIEFAILRLGYRGYTEGGLFLDQTFEQNIRGALDAGLEVGVYFFSQAITPTEAEAEAAYVLNALEGYNVTYPVTFDWEPIASGNGARTDNLDGSTLTQCAAAFCRKISAAGYQAAVYFNQDSGYLRYDLREFSEHVLWLAEYDIKPDFYYHFDLWQYSHTGTVAGIEGSVDLDLDLR
ncbi:MAG: hypothetical protein HFF44_08195 [Lawsonibacter sp.]|nr:hypothetical protein [Lawsonibacter sp.]